MIRHLMTIIRATCGQTINFTPSAQKSKQGENNKMSFQPSLGYSVLFPFSADV